MTVNILLEAQNGKKVRFWMPPEWRQEDITNLSYEKGQPSPYIDVAYFVGTVTYKGVDYPARGTSSCDHRGWSILHFSLINTAH